MKIRTLLATAAALAMLAGAAQAQTTKTIWNMPAAGQEGARVGAGSACLQDSSSGTACWNDREVTLTTSGFEPDPRPDPDPDPDPEPDPDPDPDPKPDPDPDPDPKPDPDTKG